MAAEYLLLNNASGAARDADDRTPADRAREAGAQRVLAVLAAKGML